MATAWHRASHQWSVWWDGVMGLVDSRDICSVRVLKWIVVVLVVLIVLFVAAWIYLANTVQITW